MDLAFRFLGWVTKMESCNCESGVGDCAGLDLSWSDDPLLTISENAAAHNISPCWDEHTTISARYATSLYLAFNSLEPIYER